jgi:hypothetical protein
VLILLKVPQVNHGLFKPPPNRRKHQGFAH